MKKCPVLFAKMEISAPEQAFVSDITYVGSEESVHYLSLVTDASSRKIMGYELSREMKAVDTVKALQMAVRGRVSNNALAERVNGILKQEFLFTRCRTFDELKTVIEETVWIYNHLRPHLSLGMKTPAETHEKARCFEYQA